jgi:hypothetical protein
MTVFTKRFYALACLATLVYGAPPRKFALRAADTLDSFMGSPTTPIPHSPGSTVRPASDDPNYPVYSPDVPSPAQPIRGSLGAAILGPQNIPIQEQNPDILAPPTTDHGDVCVLPNCLSFFGSLFSSPFLRPNAKWPFALSNNHIYAGGWARQQNGEPSRTMSAQRDLILTPKSR